MGDEKKNHLRVRRGWFRPSHFYRYGTDWKFEIVAATGNLHVCWDGRRRVYPPGTWKRLDVTPVRPDPGFFAMTASDLKGLG